MLMKNDVDAADSIDLDSNVDIERDGNDEKEENEEEKVEEDEYEEEEDEDEEEDVDEDVGKESQTIGQGEMVNTSADDVYTMVDDQPFVLPDQGQEIYEYTPWLQPPASASWPKAPEPCPRPRTPQNHPFIGREFLGLLISLTNGPAVPTLRVAETAGNPSDMDVDQQLLHASAGGNSLPNLPLPVAHLDGMRGEE